MRLWFALALLASASVAHADARQDIVDIRHGREPNRAEVLGWTADGAFVLRRTACEVQDLSDIPSCGVSIEVASRDRRESHPLFGKEWAIDCVEKDRPDASLGCWEISTGEAMKFIRAETDVLAKLGPLRAGTTLGTELASGTLEAVAYSDADAKWRRVAIVLSSGGRWRPLRVISKIDMDSDQFIRRNPTIDRVERSPDGASLAIVTTLPFMELDFYFDCHGLDVVANPDP